MAKKISELSGSGGANSTDQIPANQSGTTRRITVAQIIQIIPFANLTYTGLTPGHVLTAITGTTASFTTPSVDFNDVTYSGLTADYVLLSTSATSASFQTVATLAALMDVNTLGGYGTKNGGSFACFASGTSVLGSAPSVYFNDNATDPQGMFYNINAPGGTNSITGFGFFPTVSVPGISYINSFNVNPQIDDNIGSFSGVNLYGFGTGGPTSNYTGFWSQPGFSATLTGGTTHFYAGGGINGNNITGYDFNPGGNFTSGLGFQFNPQGVITDLTALNIGTPNSAANSFSVLNGNIQGSFVNCNGINLSFPASTTGSLSLCYLSTTGTHTGTAVGLNIDLTGGTFSQRPAAASLNGGSFNLNNQFSTANGLFVDSGSVFRNVIYVASGSPVTGTDVILSNLAGFMDIRDDVALGPVGLGLVSVGFVSQVAVQTGKTLDNATMCLAGFAVEASSTNGTVTDAYLFRGFASNFGGTLTVTNLYGLLISDGISAIGTNAWGISVEDINAENYLAKSLIVGGLSKVVSTGDVALEIGSAKALRLGRVTTAERTAMANTIGLMVIDTDTSFLYYNNGTTWVQL